MRIPAWTPYVSGPYASTATAEQFVNVLSRITMSDSFVPAPTVFRALSKITARCEEQPVKVLPYICRLLTVLTTPAEVLYHWIAEPPVLFEPPLKAFPLMMQS